MRPLRAFVLGVWVGLAAWALGFLIEGWRRENTRQRLKARGIPLRRTSDLPWSARPKPLYWEVR